MNLKHILLLALGHLANDVNAGALPALLPYLAAAHNLDYQTCGTLMFAYATVSSVIQPVFGLLADKKSHFWFAPLGIALAGCGLAAVGFLSSYRAIFLALVICGAGSAVFHPEGARYANRVAARRKGLGMSIFAVGGNSGNFVGPLLVTLAVGGVTLAPGFSLGGFGLPGTLVFAVFACLTAALLYVNLRGWQYEQPAGKNAADAPRNDWKAFGVLAACLTARSVLFFSFNTYLPLYWIGVFGQSPEIANLVLAGFCVCGLAGNMLGGALADRWGYAPTVQRLFFLSIPFIGLFPCIGSPWLAALCLIPVTLGLYAPFSPMVVLGQRYLGKNVGFASGITLGVAVSVGGMASPLIGWVADHYGGLPTAMQLLVGIAIIGALASLALRRERQPA